MANRAPSKDTSGGGIPRIPPQATDTGGGGGGGWIEARIAKLESDVGHIQSNITEIKSDIRDIKKEARADFRLLFGALIVATLGLAGLIAHGFKWI